MYSTDLHSTKPRWTFWRSVLRASLVSSNNAQSRWKIWTIVTDGPFFFIYGEKVVTLKYIELLSKQEWCRTWLIFYGLLLLILFYFEAWFSVALSCGLFVGYLLRFYYIKSEYTLLEFLFGFVVLFAFAGVMYLIRWFDLGGTLLNYVGDYVIGYIMLIIIPILAGLLRQKIRR